jgi:glutathione reductase (NADPH)
MSNQFDIIVIGSGVAGMSLAEGLKASGKSVAVVEDDLWGGTCPNRGCDPKKVLLAAVDAKEAVMQLNERGFNEAPTINWPDLMKFKMTFTQSVPQSSLNALESAGITAIKGRAAFIDAGHIQVGERQYGAKQFIIATGQYPAIPDIEGRQYFKTSNEFLSMAELPSKIAFVGGGYIAFELASIANACGAEVHIIHHNDRPLKQFDGEWVNLLIAQLKSSGVHIHLNTDVTSVEQRDQRYLLALKDGSEMSVDAVFSTSGRLPNLMGLQLENAGVKYDRSGVLVNDRLTTSCPTIFACGDCLAKTMPRLTPVSSFEADYLVRLLSEKISGPIVYPAVPTVIFTGYRLAQVGVDTSTAAANGDRYSIKTLDMTGWFNYRRRNESVAKAKIITEKTSGILVGATVISQEADELINFFTLIINQRLTADAMNGMIMAFPSVASDIASLY